MQIQTYSSANLEAGEQIEINLSGKVQSSGLITTQSNTTGLIIGGTFLLIVLGLGGYLLFKRSKLRMDNQEIEDAAAIEDEESILDAIIVLDDAYKNDEIPEDAYNNCRSELVEKLKKLTGAM